MISSVDAAKFALVAEVHRPEHGKRRPQAAPRARAQEIDFVGRVIARIAAQALLPSAWPRDLIAHEEWTRCLAQ